MKLNLFIIISVLNFTFVFSQVKMTEKKIDSIQKAITNDKLFNEEGLAKASQLYYQAKEINYIQGQIKALYRMAELESGLLYFSQAIDHINILKPMALDADDYKMFIDALCLESKNFFNEKNYKQSILILNQAKTYLPKITDLESRRNAKIVIDIYKWWAVESYKYPKDSYKDSLVTIAKNVCSESFYIKDKKLKANRLLFSSAWAAATLVELDRLSDAEKYLKIGEKQLKVMGELKYATADYYEAKGYFYYKSKSANKSYLDSALVNYNKSLEICKALGYNFRLKMLYPKLASVYGDKNDLKKKLYFLDKDIKLKDSLDLLTTKNINDFKQKVYSPKQPTSDSESFGKTWIYIFVVLVIVILVIVYLSVNKTRLEPKIKKITPYIPYEKIEDPVSMAKLLKLVEKNDNSFYLEFLESFPDFSSKLLKINPTLKSSDIEFCAYIRLNLDTKQIATYKIMSVRAVESKKYRMRKKLNIPAEVNMYVWMSNV